MPWQRVEEISEYRLNTQKLDAWLKSKWGNYDYQIQVNSYRHLYSGRIVNISCESTTMAYTHSGPWSLGPR